MIEFSDLNFLAWFRAFRELKNAGYNSNFTSKFILKSGVSNLTRAKQLVIELENLGLSKSIIEQAGANLGLGGLTELKGLRKSGMPESDIIKKLNTRIDTLKTYFNYTPINTTPSRMYLLNTIRNDKRLTYSVSALISSLIILSLAVSVRLLTVQANYFSHDNYLIFSQQPQQIWILAIIIFLMLISLTAMLFTIISWLKRNRGNDHVALIKKYFFYELIAILLSLALFIPTWLFIFHNYSYITENGICCRNDYYSSEETFTWDDIHKAAAKAYMTKSFLSDERLKLSYVLYLDNGRQIDLWQAFDSYKRTEKIEEINKILISQNIPIHITPIDTITLQNIDNTFSEDKLDQVKSIYHN